jgi:hypothetical protein
MIALILSRDLRGPRRHGASGVPATMPRRSIEAHVLAAGERNSHAKLVDHGFVSWRAANSWPA